jgi:hypothetical protein
MKKLMFLMIMLFVVLMIGGLIAENIYAGGKCDNPTEARPIPLNYSECMDVCAECNRQAVAKCDDQYRGDTTKHKACLTKAREKYDEIRQECTIFNK